MLPNCRRCWPGCAEVRSRPPISGRFLSFAESCMSISYQTALITGASSGIGAAFAQALAAQGTDLILVARSADKLEALAAILRSRHARRVDVLVADLGLPGAAARVAAEVGSRGLQVDLLINNAGFGREIGRAHV